MSDHLFNLDACRPTSTKRYWKTPADTYAALNAELGPFDFDPCPYPRPTGFNGLLMPWENETT
jgi:hypothetical protein